MKKLTLFLAALAPFALLGASHRAPGANQYQSDKVDRLTYELKTIDDELRSVKERLITQEDLFDNLEKVIVKETQSSGERMKNTHQSLLLKVQQLEEKLTRIEEYLSSLDPFLTELENKVENLEKQSQKQAKITSNLESALKQVITSMKGEEATQVTIDSDRMYRVKQGDNLEKIAKKHNTSVRVLKELNSLNTDKIYIGQRLKVPAQ